MLERRVLVDATAIPLDRGGVGRYVEGLLQGLEDVGFACNLVVAAQARDVETFGQLAGSALIAPVSRQLERTSARLVWEQAILPGLRRRMGVDIVHSPHYTHPVMANCAKVVTLHDATYFSLPTMHTALKRRFFQAWTRRSVWHADGLITVSESTRRDVLREVGGDPSRFTVAPLGVNHGVFRPPNEDEVSEFRRIANIGGHDWIAFLGTLEPRKNVPSLIRGYVKAFRNRSRPPVLLLAGSAGWDEEVDVELRRVPRPLLVRRLGYLPRHMLAAFLGGSVVVAYPSVGEGFGLPVLEAMSCGAVVLTCRNSSLPEVGGDAVEYVDTDDRSIAGALTRLVDEPSRRRALAVAALTRSREFTWRRCAERHILAYDRALVAHR